MSCKGAGGTTVSLPHGLCTPEHDIPPREAPLDLASQGRGLLPFQTWFPFQRRASHSLRGVQKSRGMKASEGKYNCSAPSSSQAAQIRFWRWVVICLSSKLVRNGSPFPHWSTHDLSAWGERNITTLPHLGHHCQIEGLGRSRFTQGKCLCAVSAEVQTASSPQSRRGAKHPLAFCLLREMLWIWECERGKEQGSEQLVPRNAQLFVPPQTPPCGSCWFLPLLM